MNVLAFSQSCISSLPVSISPSTKTDNATVATFLRPPKRTASPSVPQFVKLQRERRDDDREYDIQCPRSASRDHFGEFSSQLWQPIVMSPPPSYGRTIWLLGTSDKKFAVSRRGSRDLARSLAALVGYLPTHSTPPGAMGNSKAGGVEESNLGDRTTLLNPFDTGQRTHCGGWETTLSASARLLSLPKSAPSLLGFT